MSWKEFQSIERDFDNMYDGDYDISHYQTELKPIGLYTKEVFIRSDG